MTFKTPPQCLLHMTILYDSHPINRLNFKGGFTLKCIKTKHNRKHLFNRSLLHSILTYKLYNKKDTIIISKTYHGVPHFMKTPLAPLFFAIACVPFLFACNKEAEVKKDYPRPIKVMQIDIAQDATTRLFKAEVQASAHAVLSFRVSGEIQKINVKAGQHVKKGDVLALLDPATYQQELEVAKAEYGLQDALYARSKQLVSKNFISKNDFDKTKSAYISAKSFLESQQNRLNYTQLRAPYDGIISNRFVREYQFVAGKQDIFGFQGKTNVDVLFQLPEQYIGPLQQNYNQEGKALKLEVKFSGREAWSEAILKELSTVADSATGSYSVVATLSKPENFNALSGMAAEIRIHIPVMEAIQSKIPSGAVLVENGKQYLFIWLKDQKSVKKVAVEIEDGMLKSGLNDGDWIVSAGAHELNDGQSVVQWVKERGL